MAHDRRSGETKAADSRNRCASRSRKNPSAYACSHRDARNAFSVSWSVGRRSRRARRPARAPGRRPAKPIAIRHNGDPATKVDLLIIGDGYTGAGASQVRVRRAPPRRSPVQRVAVQGARRRLQRLGAHRARRASPACHGPRPARTATPRSTRATTSSAASATCSRSTTARCASSAQYAPYEFIEILVNNETYGGGGIFGQFSTAAASNDWSEYLFVHEFGHHFAALADEYYTSPTCVPSRRGAAEPWEAERHGAAGPRAVEVAPLVTPARRCRRPGPSPSSRSTSATSRRSASSSARPSGPSRR
jgi:hypothetical protein